MAPRGSLSALGTKPISSTSLRLKSSYAFFLRTKSCVSSDSTRTTVLLFGPCTSTRAACCLRLHMVFAPPTSFLGGVLTVPVSPWSAFPSGFLDPLAATATEPSTASFSFPPSKSAFHLLFSLSGWSSLTASTFLHLHLEPPKEPKERKSGKNYP